MSEKSRLQDLAPTRRTHKQNPPHTSCVALVWNIPLELIHIPLGVVTAIEGVSLTVNTNNMHTITHNNILTQFLLVVVLASYSCCAVGFVLFSS